MATAGEILSGLSGLSNVSAATHLLAITAGSGLGAGAGELVVGVVVDDYGVLGVLGADDAAIGVFDEDTVVGIAGSGEMIAGVAFEDDPVSGKAGC